jgi:hypothetical protein
MLKGASLTGRRSAPAKLAKAPLRASMVRLQSAFPFSATWRSSHDCCAVIGVFHGDEDIGPAFPDGDRLRHVCSPHFIDLIGDDRPIVRLGLGASNAMRREQAVLTHHPSHTAGARANATSPPANKGLDPEYARPRQRTKSQEVTTGVYMGERPGRRSICQPARLPAA